MVPKTPNVLSDWKYRRKIVINHKEVSSNDQTDFPVLLSLVDDDLRLVSEGGHVAQSQGEDFLFTSSDGVTKLDHEIERYNPMTGELKVWVRVPALSHTTDTVLYLYYGNSVCSSQQNRSGVWDSNYKLVLHLSEVGDIYHDSTSFKNDGIRKIVDQKNGEKPYIEVPHSDSLNITDRITVEAWVNSENPNAEVMQSIISKWSPLTTFDTFDAYDAGNTGGLNTKGFFGAVFDGRYVYFVPQYDGVSRHGKVLRYDTHGEFTDSESWNAYDAGNTSGLNTKGYYGAVFDGRYVYFVPRTDGLVMHSRVLRYDTEGEFTDEKSWCAHDAGNPVSYQAAAFDGRYIYFAPGYEGDFRALSGKVLRYDTKGEFTDNESYITYDAGNTMGLETKCYDGAVFDGRYVYFAPLDSIGMMLRYDTKREFTDAESWSAYDARYVSGLKMGSCVGAVFDGRYVYFVPYAHSVVLRYDTNGEFTDKRSWNAYDAGNTDGLNTRGYDGAVFDGKYIYFIPFWEGEDLYKGFHGKVLRYDTTGKFTDEESWSAYDAGNTGGLATVGFNGGAFDGRFIYFAPWREGTDPDGRIISHGRVLRYDTIGGNASFSLRYMDYGHNGGLCGALPGPSFLVNTSKGVLNARANRNLQPGIHQIVGVYDGSRIMLFIDGDLIAERTGTGTIQVNNVNIAIGRILNGLGYFDGVISEVRISDTARSVDWIKTEYNNYRRPSRFYCIEREESLR